MTAGALASLWQQLVSPLGALAVAATPTAEGRRSTLPRQPQRPARTHSCCQSMCQVLLQGRLQTPIPNTAHWPCATKRTQLETQREAGRLLRATQAHSARRSATDSRASSVAHGVPRLPCTCTQASIKSHRHKQLGASSTSNGRRGERCKLAL